MLEPITSTVIPMNTSYPNVSFPIQTHPGSIDESLHRGYVDRQQLLDVQNREVERYMDKIIQQADNTTSFLKSNDFKKFGLLPGQQIAYAGGFGLKAVTHHGIYIGNGIVAEVASQSCLRKCLLNAANFNTLCFGLSTMTDFAKRANSKGFPVLLFQHKGYNDAKPSLIRERLRRVKEIVSSSGNHWRQWVLTHNCESAANYVSYGKMETKQGQVNSLTIVIAYAMNKGLGGLARGFHNNTGVVTKSSNKNCKSGTCMDRDITSTGCVCESGAQTSMMYGKYCYVDGKLCKTETRKDSTGLWGNVVGKKRTCVRNTGKKKYLTC